MKLTYLFCVSTLVLAAACEPEGGNAFSTAWRDGDVLAYHKASFENPFNLVILGNGFTDKDFERGGNWEKIGTDLAKAFVEAPVIRDYKDYFNVSIYFALSHVDSYAADNLKGTPFKPDGGNSPHPSRPIIAERLKAAIPDIDARGGMGSGYFVICMNNLRSCQWDWHSVGVATGDRSVENNYVLAKQFVYHELIGHGFAGLFEEYAGSGDSNWGGVQPNTNGHGFPAYGTKTSLTPYKLSEVGWPDDPGGPMAWANAIFGDQKGDGFLALTLPKEVTSDPHLEKYFIKNSRVAGKAFDYDYTQPGDQTTPTWLMPAEDKSSAWTTEHSPSTADWRLWPGWVAFIGRTGYTYTTYKEWLRPAPWINRIGGGSFNYQSDDACAMRQTTDEGFFCPLCRYRIWVQIQRRFNADGYNKAVSDYWMSFDDGKFGGKFPSEFGLRRFAGNGTGEYNDRVKNKIFGSSSS